MVFLAAGVAKREALPAVQSSETRTFQASADATLSENAPTTKFGASTTNSVDGDDPSGSGKESVTLLKWDLSSIPQGDVVLSAQFELNVTNASTEGYELYRMSRDWKEGEATWNEAETGTPWDVPGASGALDHGFTARGVVQTGGTGPVTITLGAEGITAVQAWVDGPGENYGFIIADGTNSDGLAFSSREAATSSLRPKLIVTFMANSGSGGGAVTIPDGGSGFCGATGMEAALVIGLLALIRRRSAKR